MVGQDSRIYILRKRGKGWRPDLVEARRAKPCFAVMIWGCITWHGVDTITAVEGNINAQIYQQILDDSLLPVIAQHFPNDQYIFQDDGTSCTFNLRIHSQKWHNNNDCQRTRTDCEIICYF